VDGCLLKIARSNNLTFCDQVSEFLLNFLFVVLKSFNAQESLFLMFAKSFLLNSSYRHKAVNRSFISSSFSWSLRSTDGGDQF